MSLPTFERIRANARDRRPHLPAPQPGTAPPATTTGTGNIATPEWVPLVPLSVDRMTPLDALCAIQVALRLTYGGDGPRIWRLSGARVPADWRPDTAHEDLIAHAARQVQP